MRCLSCTVTFYSISALLLSAAVHHTGAMTANPEVVFTEYQPDGTPISLLLRGDERRNWISDLEDFVVLKTDDGTYVYAEEMELDETTESTGSRKMNTVLVPALDHVVGKFNPSRGVANGELGEGTKLARQQYNWKEDCFKRICGGVPEPRQQPNIFDGKQRNLRRRQQDSRHLLTEDPGPHFHRRESALPSTGTIRNLVVLIQFGDHRRSRRVLPSVSQIQSHMDSVKELYLENSFGSLNIESTVVPSWYTTRSSEAWYADNRSGSTNLHEAIRDALSYLDDNEIINFSDFDTNGDGYVDMLTVLHSGYAAEHGVRDCKGSDYKQRIWTHQWELFGDSEGNNIGPFVSSDNTKVWTYQMAPVLWGRCGNSVAHVGAVAHEIGHSLGLPDLNDADGSGNGIGGYCLMSDPWGFDRSQQRPSQLSAWARMKLGWIHPKTPNYGFNKIFYAEEPSSMVQAYKIGDGEHNFPENEYLLIEYRKRRGMDSDLPGEGLLIYHIDETAVANNNEGHPWQDDGFPRNGKHYRVSLLQADRLYSLERGINNGGSRDFFHAGYIDNLMPSSDADAPWNGPFPNTDRYQNGIVAHTGVQIYDISGAGGGIMSFYFWGSGDNPTLSIPAGDSSGSNGSTGTSAVDYSRNKYNFLP